jgi:hypothetical protein
MDKIALRPDMKKKLLFLLLVIFVLSAAGCSFVVRANIPGAETATSDWTEDAFAIHTGLPLINPINISLRTLL